MKFRYTLVFTVLFFVVLGFYFSQSRQELKKQEELKKATDDFKIRVEEKLPTLKINENIDFIQVQNLEKDETFWLQKENSIWRITYPVGALADQSIAIGMSGMVKLAMKTKLMRPESGWSEYGLDQPVMKIGIGSNGSSERHFLYLGRKTPTGDMVFARWDDKQAYFVLPAQVKDAFRKTIYEVREKRVFLTPVTKIDRIFAEIGGRSFDMTLRDGVWYWMEPIHLIGQTVAPEQVSAMLQMLAQLYVKEFADDVRDVFKAGVTMISDRLQVRSGNNTETVYLGNEVPLKTSYFAHRENEKNLFLVDQSKIFQVIDLLDALRQANRPPEEKSK